LGFFVGALGTLLGGRFWLPVFLSALAMLGIEVLQLFMVSGRAEVGNIAVAALGGSVGVWAMRLTRRAPSRVLVWIAVLIKAFAPFYLLMLPIAHGLKIQGFADGAAIYRAAEQLNFLPFYYHYYTTEQNALASTVLILASLLPLGIAMRVIAPRVRGIPVALAGFLLTALLEAAKLLQLAERPDPTNLLIGALGAWLGLVFMRWLVEVLPNLRREPL
jgi:glycopeptide antibiotics resistance protein